METEVLQKLHLETILEFSPILKFPLPILTFILRKMYPPKLDSLFFLSLLHKCSSEGKACTFLLPKENTLYPHYYHHRCHYVFQVTRSGWGTIEERSARMRKRRVGVNGEEDWKREIGGK